MRSFNGPRGIYARRWRTAARSSRDGSDSASTGQPVDIDYGGRLSGRIGPWSVGALAVRQDELRRRLPRPNAFVGRACPQYSRKSRRLGMIVNGAAIRVRISITHVVGADFRYLNSRLPGGRNAGRREIWYQQHVTRRAWKATMRLMDFRLRSPNNSGVARRNRLEGDSGKLQSGAGVSSTVRACTRRDVSRLGYTHRPRERAALPTSRHVSMAQRIDLIGGGLQSELADAGARSSLRAAAGTELIAPFLSLPRRSSRSRSRSPMASLFPVGTYSFNESELELPRQVSQRRPWSGEFHNTGRETSTTANGSSLKVRFTWTPSPHSRDSRSGYDYNDVDLPQGDFLEIRLVTLQADIVISHRRCPG